MRILLPSLAVAAFTVALGIAAPGTAQAHGGWGYGGGYGGGYGYGYRPPPPPPYGYGYYGGWRPWHHHDEWRERGWYGRRW